MVGGSYRGMCLGSLIVALLLAVLPARAADPYLPLLQAELLRDPGGQLSATEVADPALRQQGRWQPVGRPSLALGHSRDAIWLRFVLPAHQEGTPERWLVAGLPYLDDLRLYSPGADLSQPLRAGDHVPVAQRPTRLREAVFPLRLGAEPGAEPGVYLLRVQSSSTLTLQLALWQPLAYTERAATQQALHGLLQGLMLTSAALSLLAGLWLRQRFFFIAAAYLLCFGAMNLVLNGYDQLLLYPQTPWLSDHVVGVLGYAVALLIVAFSLSYLQPLALAPRLTRTLQRLAGVFAAGVLVSGLGGYAWIAPWLFRLALLAVLLLLWLFMLLLLRHPAEPRQKALLLLLMFMPGLLAICLQVLRNLGLLPTNFWTTGLWELTAFFQMPYAAVVVLLRVRDEQRRLATAERREREQQDFLNMMAHELRTPLAVLGAALANIELRVEAQQPEMKPRFQRATAALTRLNMLVDKALADNRLRDAPFVLDLQPTRPSELVEQVRVLLHIEPPHREQISLPADDSPVPLDAHWLGMALLNLLDNAVKYSPDGGLVALNIERDANALRLSVQDSGIGVPPEAQARLFERFFRAPNARQLGGVQGLGLGLFLVAEVARRHGGTVAVDSQAGQGSRFTVTIPLAVAKTANPAA